MATSPVGLGFQSIVDCDRAVWDTAMQNHRTITAEWRAYGAYFQAHLDRCPRDHSAVTPHLEVASAALTDAVVSSETALLELPAPDSAALRWKLDVILNDEGDGKTIQWNMDCVRQTIDDYRRLLGSDDPRYARP